MNLFAPIRPPVLPGNLKTIFGIPKALCFKTHTKTFETSPIEFSVRSTFRDETTADALMDFGSFIEKSQEREREFREQSEYLPEEEEQSDPSQSPFSIEAIVAEHNEDYVGQVIRFTWSELLALSEMCERHLAQSGRGRKRKLRPIDQLLILLLYLISGFTFRAIATLLLLSKSLIQRVIDKCLVQLDGKCDSLFPQSSQSVQCNIVFKNYACVFGVVDASTVFINRPTGHQD
jgi:hypothetical protein